MTPQQIADKKAYHRAELERLDALEKAQRPALAAGQVWRSPEWGVSIVCSWDGVSGSIYNIKRQSLVRYSSGLADCFVFLGLARDVLRVVPPDAGVAMKQVAPVQDEPTGAELVKRLCWVREEEGSPWIGPAVIDQWDKEGRDGLWYMTMDKAVAGAWFIDAKLYREGVTP
jgi:hypothetical protein